MGKRRPTTSTSQPLSFPSKTSFNSLSLDVFEMILDEVVLGESVSHERYALLARCSRVSKLWTDPCLRRLYSKISIGEAEHATELAQSDALGRYPTTSLDVRPYGPQDWDWQTVKEVVERCSGLKAFTIRIRDRLMPVPIELLQSISLQDVQSLTLDCTFSDTLPLHDIQIPFQPKYLATKMSPDHLPILETIIAACRGEGTYSLTTLTLPLLYDTALPILTPIAATLTTLNLEVVEQHLPRNYSQSLVATATATFLSLTTSLKHLSIGIGLSIRCSAVPGWLSSLMAAVVAPLHTFGLFLIWMEEGDVDYSDVLKVLKEVVTSSKAFEELSEFRIYDDTVRFMKASTEWTEFVSVLENKHIQLVEAADARVVDPQLMVSTGIW